MSAPDRRPAAAPRLSRRSLVKRASALVLLGAAGSGGALAVGHGGRYVEAEPACELRYLDRREYCIVAALADSLFPPNNSIGLSGSQARVPEYIDRYLHGMQPDKASDFVAMLLLFEHGTAAFGLRVRRFTDLPQPAREQYLRKWERARVYSRRMLSTALKNALGMAYFAYPGVQAKLGIRFRCASPADAKPREEWA